MWLIYAILAAVTWGLDYSLTGKIFQNKVSVSTLLTLQLISGSIIFSIIGFFSDFKSDINLIISNNFLLSIIIVVLISSNVANFFIFLSIKGKNATYASLIELCYPFFTAIFSWILFGESHLNLQTLIGAILIVVGVIIIMIY